MGISGSSGRSPSPATLDAGWRIPKSEACAGAACLVGWKVASSAAKKLGADQALNTAKGCHEQDKETLKKAKKAAAQKEVINLWQDPSATRSSPDDTGRWREHAPYWADVRLRVVNSLAKPKDRPKKP